MGLFICMWCCDFLGVCLANTVFPTTYFHIVGNYMLTCLHFCPLDLGQNFVVAEGLAGAIDCLILS